MGRGLEDVLGKIREGRVGFRFSEFSGFGGRAVKFGWVEAEDCLGSVRVGRVRRFGVFVCVVGSSSIVFRVWLV